MSGAPYVARPFPVGSGGSVSWMVIDYFSLFVGVRPDCGYESSMSLAMNDYDKRQIMHAEGLYHIRVGAGPGCLREQRAWCDGIY